MAFPSQRGLSESTDPVLRYSRRAPIRRKICSLPIRADVCPSILSACVDVGVDMCVSPGSDDFCCCVGVKEAMPNWKARESDFQKIRPANVSASRSM